MSDLKKCRDFLASKGTQLDFSNAFAELLPVVCEERGITDVENVLTKWKPYMDSDYFEHWAENSSVKFVKWCATEGLNPEKTSAFALVLKRLMRQRYREKMMCATQQLLIPSNRKDLALIRSLIPYKTDFVFRGSSLLKVPPRDLLNKALGALMRSSSGPIKMAPEQVAREFISATKFILEDRSLWSEGLVDSRRRPDVLVQNDVGNHGIIELKAYSSVGDWRDAVFQAALHGRLMNIGKVPFAVICGLSVEKYIGIKILRGECIIAVKDNEKFISEISVEPEEVTFTIQRCRNEMVYSRKELRSILERIHSLGTNVEEYVFTIDEETSEGSDDENSDSRDSPSGKRRKIDSAG